VACDWAQPTLRDRAADLTTSDRPSPVNSESCRLIQHEMGETEVCGQPQKVVALSPHMLDNMLALGVQPVAYAESRDSKIQTYNNPTEQIPYLGKWVTTKPIGLGSRESPSLERLTLLKPDLILGEKFASEDKYSLLTQIAPTLLFDDKLADGQHSWQKNINEIGKALSREDQAKELLINYSEKVIAVREQLASVVKAHPRMLVIESDSQSHNIFLAEYNLAAKLLQEIGFEIVSSKNSSILPESKPFEDFSQISIELLPQIETDFICVLAWANEDYNPQRALKQVWEINPLLKQVPAFKEGHIFFVSYNLWGSLTRGPLTDQLILEALPDLLLNSVEEEKPNA
jgi:iron complex transport system substrate-binding protein